MEGPGGAHAEMGRDRPAFGEDERQETLEVFALGCVHSAEDVADPAVFENVDRAGLGVLIRLPIKKRLERCGVRVVVDEAEQTVLALELSRLATQMPHRVAVGGLDISEVGLEACL